MGSKSNKPLTDKEIRNAKIPEGQKVRKLFDGNGLHLFLKGNTKSWRFAYRFNRKAKTLCLGSYPSVSLKEARNKRHDAEKLKEKGIDPNQHKKEQKIAITAKQKEEEAIAIEKLNTFQTIALRWVQNQTQWTDKYNTIVSSRLKNHVFPSMGNTPIRQVTRAQVANVINSIVEKGTVPTADRVARIIHSILEYSCDIGLIEALPMGRVKNLTPAHTPQPMRTITDPERIGELLQAIDKYNGEMTTIYALKLLPHLAVRSEEFREAHWREINFTSKIWTIPSSIRKHKKKMKADPKLVHLVPLSKQALSLLKQLHALTGSGERLFPSCGKNKSDPISENTLNKALTAMGFGGEIVAHGFRSMFSTLMNERCFNPDAIERQLAHIDKNTVRRAYNRADYKEERVIIMQDWSNCIDNMHKEGTLPPLKNKATN